MNRGDGDDHVEDLLQGEVVADLVSALRGGQERQAGREHPGAAALEEGITPVRVLEIVGQARDPSNAAKLDAADALAALADESGITLVQLAIAFVTRHPAVTSAIIGPRTMEHLDAYLAADSIDLSGDLLDAIDRIVPPAVTINFADNMWEFSTRALDAPFRRR